MAFPVTPAAVPKWLVIPKWQDAVGKMRQLRMRSEQVRTWSSALDAENVLRLVSMLSSTKQALTTLKSDPEAVGFAKERTGNPSFDVVAEVDQVIAAIDPALDWLVANFPKDANGWLQFKSLNPDGSTNTRDITKVQLDPLRPMLQSIEAAISV